MVRYLIVIHRKRKKNGNFYLIIKVLQYNRLRDILNQNNAHLLVRASTDS